MDENEEVLGISAQFDLSDIIAGIRQLDELLAGIGVSAENLSQRMKEALKEIEDSTDDASTKNARAMEVLRSAMEEAQKAIVAYPDKLNEARDAMSAAEKATENLGAKLETLNTKLEFSSGDEAEKLQAEIAGVEAQIENEQKSLAQHQEVIGSLQESYNSLIEIYDRWSNALAEIPSGMSGIEKAEREAEQGSAQYLESVESLTSKLEALSAEYEALSQKESLSGDDIIKVKEAETSLGEIIASVRGLDEQLDELREKSGDAFMEGNDDAYRYYEQVAETLRKNAKEYDAIGVAAEELREKLSSLDAVMAEQSQSVDSSSERMSASVESYETLREKIGELQSSLEMMQAEYERLNSKEILSQKDIQRLGELRNAITEDTRELETLRDKLGDAPAETFTGRARQGFQKLEEKIEDIKQRIRELGDKLAKPITDFNNRIAESNFGQKFSAEFKQVNGAVSEFTNKIGGWITGNGRFKESINDISKAFEGMPIPIKGAVARIKTMTTAMLRMAMTPLGAVIAALVLAFKSLSAWFTKSAEGQLAFAKVSGYLKSVLDSITDVVIKLGGYIYKTFADSSGHLHAFAKDFVGTFKKAIETVVNLFSGIGNVGKGLFEGLSGKGWETFHTGIDQTKKGIKGIGETIAGAFKTTVDGVKGTAKVVADGADAISKVDFGEAISRLNTKAKEQSDIAEREKAIQLDILDTKQKQAQLDIEIAENYQKIYQATGKERAELIKVTKELMKQKYEGWTDEEGKQHKGIIELQKEQLKMQQQKNAAHASTLEDLAREKELQTQVYRTQAEAASSLRMLARLEAQTERSMERGAGRDDKAALKLNEVEITNIFAQEDSLLNLESRLAEARVKAMQEGYAKVAAERDRQNDESLKALDQEEKKLIEAERKRQKAIFEAQQAYIASKGGKAVNWDDTMFDNNEYVQKLREYYSQLRTATISVQLEEEIKNEDALIQSHASYIDKKTEIDKDYQETVNSINAAILEAEKRGDTERVESLTRSLAEVAKQRAKSQASLSLAELKESPDYIRAFEDMKNTSTETLELLIQKFEATKQAAAANLDPTELREYTEAIQRMKDALVERDPFSRFKESLEELGRASQQAEGAKRLYDAVKNGAQVIRGVVKENGKLTVAYWSEADAAKNLSEKQDNLNKKRTTFSKNIQEAAKHVGTLANNITNLGNAMSGTAGEILQIVGSVVSFTSSAIDSLVKISEESSKAVKTVETASLILTIASTAISIFNKIRSISEKNRQEAEEKRKEIEELRQAVEDYRMAVLDARRAEDSWFASTGLDNLTASYQKYIDTLDSYRAAVAQTIRTLGGSRIGTNDDIRGTRTDKERYDDVLVARYEAGKKKGGERRWEEYKLSDLLLNEELGRGMELWDESGFINIEAAETALEHFGDHMDDETKRTIENLIKQREAWDEYVKALRDYVSEMYSPLLDNLTDAVWNWLETGEDAMDKFNEYASDTFADIGREMVRQFLLDSVFDDYKKKLQSIYDGYAKSGGEMSYEDLLAQVSAATAEMKDSMGLAIEGAQAIATAYKDAAESLGFSTSSSAAADKKATAVAAEKITYEQADRLEGILTAMQIVQGQSLNSIMEQVAVMNAIQPLVVRIDSNVGNINTSIGGMVELQRTANGHLERIEINTRQIPNIADYTERIWRKIDANY